jgi:hypothetical protein
MSELLPPDEPSIAAAGADPGRRNAAAQEARGAQAFAVTSAPAATPIPVGSRESQLRVWRETGNRMRRPCRAPSSSETQSSWERFRMAGGYLRYSARAVDAQVEARRARRGERPGDFVLLADWRHHQGPSQ